MGKNNQKISYDLENIKGTKFKNMWSTKILYLVLYSSYLVFVIIQGTTFIKYGKFIDKAELGSVLALILFSVFVNLVLIFINKKFVGKTVAVLDSMGIYTEYEMIPWKSINMIKYNTTIPTRSINKEDIYCSLSIYTSKKEYKVLHAPRKIIREIKKSKNDIKIKHDIELICIMLCPIVFAIIFSFTK